MGKTDVARLGCATVDGALDVATLVFAVTSLAVCAFVGRPGASFAAEGTAADERHAFAVGRVAVAEGIEAGDAPTTVHLRCRCPLDGEYSVVVLYDGHLQGIDARIPHPKRPFAGSVAVAMNVGLHVTITDVTSGMEVTPEPIASTVFDAATRRRKWSGERLAVFRLEGGAEYRIAVSLEGSSPAWMALHPVVILDPSDEVTKVLAMKHADRRP